MSRTMDSVATTRGWSPLSNLTSTSPGADSRRHAYDASGQRVAQALVADANGLGTATGYVASGQVEDPNTATTSTGDTTATRFYTFGGSTVAVRTNDGKLALMLGDEQGSTSVVMPVTVQAGGGLASATLADAAAVTRTSYTPYGELRGEDNPAVDRGWLGQVEDRVSADGASGTGLTYLNARYYDPVASRFISPDPLMNPTDPKTLDPYRYADNNPVVFTDATGLYSTVCGGITGKSKSSCDASASHYKPVGTKSPFTPGTPDGGGVQSLPKAKKPVGVAKALPPTGARPSAGPTQQFPVGNDPIVLPNGYRLHEDTPSQISDLLSRPEVIAADGKKSQFLDYVEVNNAYFAARAEPDLFDLEGDTPYLSDAVYHAAMAESVADSFGDLDVAPNLQGEHARLIVLSKAQFGASASQEITTDVAASWARYFGKILVLKPVGDSASTYARLKLKEVVDEAG